LYPTFFRVTTRELPTREAPTLLRLRRSSPLLGRPSGEAAPGVDVGDRVLGVDVDLFATIFIFEHQN
jgi:hypothetical protein